MVREVWYRLTDRNLALRGVFAFAALAETSQRTRGGRRFKVCVFPIRERSDIQVMASNVCGSILFCAVCSLDLHQDLLAAVSSQQLEDQLYTGLMGNAKVEYHPRIRCLQWLNVTHMDENSFWDVYLYRLYSIILYWDPDYTNKQETKQEKQPKPMWGLWSQCFGYRWRRWKIGTRNLAHFWKVLTFLWCLFFFCSCLKHTKRQREAPFADLRLVHVHDVKFWNKEAVILMTEKINPSHWFVSCTVLSFLSVFFKILFRSGFSTCVSALCWKELYRVLNKCLRLSVPWKKNIFSPSQGHTSLKFSFKNSVC